MPNILYARKSQESEERQAQSIPDQLRLCRETAQRNGLTILEEITESKSAKEPGQRPGFARMLHLLQTGAADGILAWHPDRLSRNELDAAQITYLLRKGTLQSLQFVTYTFQNTPEGVMMLQMALSQSQYYSTKLAVDVRRGLSTKVGQGWCPHRAPDGYINDLATHTIQADPERFPLVRQAWEMLLTGCYTVGQIVRMLNEDWGYTTRVMGKTGGGPLALATAYRLFHNPYYTGSFREKGVLHPGSHPAMITVEEYVRAQAFLAREGKRQPKKHAFAYTGLMRCRCGEAVTAEVKHGRSGKGHYVYYHCANRLKQCSRISVREEDLEAQIEQRLRLVTVDTETLAFARAEVASWREGMLLITHSAVEERQASTQEEVSSQMQRLLDLHLRGTVAAAIFEERYARLKEQAAHLEQAGAEQQEQVEQVKQSAENVLRFREEAHGRFLRGTAQEKREIAQALGVSYGFWRGDVEIETHPALLPHLKVEWDTDGTPRVMASLKYSSTRAADRPFAITAVSTSSLLATPVSGNVSNFLVPTAPEFETRITRYRSTKKTRSNERVSVGWASDRLAQHCCSDAMVTVSLWEFFSSMPDCKRLAFT